MIPMHTAKIDANMPVLEIDVEKAWDELGLVAGWGNEVKVEVLVM